MARIGITAMPERGVDISLIPISGGRCIVRLFKDEQSTEVDGMTQITADVVELEMVYYDGLQLEVESNFDKYFEIGAQKELADAKTKYINEIKEKINTDFVQKIISGDITVANYADAKTELDQLTDKCSAIEAATTIDQIEAIVNG